MKPLKVTVLFDQQISAGEDYQLALNAAMLMNRLWSHVLTSVFFTTLKGNIEVLKGYGIDAHYFHFPLLRRAFLILRRLIKHPWPYLLLKAVAGGNALELCFTKHAIDLVYFLSPNGHTRRGSWQPGTIGRCRFVSGSKKPGTDCAGNQVSL